MHTDEGGGRNRGEACHVYDFFTYLTDSRVESVRVIAVSPRTSRYSHRDNFVATIKFEDGSVAALTYSALGGNGHGKEHLEIFVDDKLLVLNDYRQLTIAGRPAKTPRRAYGDKGHRQELEAFARIIQDGGDWPIPLWQQFQAARIALEVETQLAGGD